MVAEANVTTADQWEAQSLLVAKSKNRTVYRMPPRAFVSSVKMLMYRFNEAVRRVDTEIATALDKFIVE